MALLVHRSFFCSSFLVPFTLTTSPLPSRMHSFAFFPARSCFSVLWDLCRFSPMSSASIVRDFAPSFFPPVPRSEILLGKNLALLPPFLLLTALPLIGIQLLASPPILYTLSAFLQALTLCLLLTLFGNLLSIKAHYRSKPGSLQPVQTKSGASALMNTLFPFLFLLLLIPATLPLLVEELSRWIPFFSFPWNITLSALSLLAVALVYRQSLHSMGNLLASREQEILRIVTEQVD